MPDLRPCVKCGEHIVVGDRYCPHCGAEQPARATNVLSGAPASRWEDIEKRLQEATEGRYLIRGLLGRGGMAAVYLAEWPQMDLRIAIKVMDPYLLDQEHAVQRFLQEARTIAKLRHRNIIRVYDSGRAGDLYFFCMDYYPGRSLERVLQTEGRIPIRVARVWLWQAADALGYAHRQSKPVVHRDVKPSNMLLDADGDLVLTDFGIAKVRDLESTSPSASLTMPGAVLGTPAYLSPEQAATILDPQEVGKPAPITSASDQYSLGVVAYEMLAGDLPFQGELGPLLAAHARETPIHLLEKRPDCPPDLAEAVMRMLAKRPEDRWGGMHELGAVLAGAPPVHGSPLRVQMGALARGERPVGAISLSPIPGSLFEGQDFKIDATPLDLVGRPLEGRRLAWASSDPAIARVTQDGVVQALRAGAVCITASAEGISQEIQLAVAPIPVEAVVVLPSQLTLPVGDAVVLRTLLLSREGRELEGREVRWASSDPDIALTDGTGKVEALRTGEVTVTASAGERSGSAAVNVIPRAVARVEISPATLTLEAGVSGELRALPVDAGGEALVGRPVRWESDDPAVVRVLGDGRLEAVAPGRAGVRAVCEGVTGGGSILVLPPRVASLLLSPSDPSVQEGDTLTLEATPRSERGLALSGRSVHWESGDSAVVVVEEGGRLRGVRSGWAEVRARCEGIAAALRVQVTPAPVAALQLFPASLEMTLGEPRPLVAVVRGPRGDTLPGRAVRWVSSDTAVVAVTPEGLVDPLAVGSARVCATCEGVSAEAEVTVAPAPVEALDVAEDALTLEVGDARTVAAVAKGRGGVVLPDRGVTWVSLNPEVVEVDGRGGVAALSEGGGEIRVECEGVSRTLTVKVVPERVTALQLSPPALRVAAEESARLEATPLGRSGRRLGGRPVRWVSDDPSVASVGPTGEVVGVSPGETSVRALCDPVTSVARVTVSPAAMASLEIAPATLSLGVGETGLLEAVARSGKGARLKGRTLTWSVGDPSVAEVSQEGVVDGKGVGATTVHVKGEGLGGEAVVDVAAVPEVAVEVEEVVPEGVVTTAGVVAAAPGMTAAAPRVAAAAPKEAAPLPARASASRPVPRKPRRAGWAGVGAGVVMVAAVLAFWRPWAGGEDETAPDAPAAPVPAALAILPGDSLSLTPGELVTLSLSGTNASGLEISSEALPSATWACSDTVVATVSSTGVVRASGPGRARVTASISGDREDAPPLTASVLLVVTGQGAAGAGMGAEPATQERAVQTRPTPGAERPRPAEAPPSEAPRAPAVTAIRLQPGQGELVQGETLQLRLTDQGGNPVAGSFHSSDPSVADISASGLLSAVGAGSVRVTASFQGLTTTGAYQVRALVVDPPSAALDSLRQGLVRAEERASLAEYDAAYRILDALGASLAEMGSSHPGSSLLPPVRSDYLRAFSSVYEGCRRFRQVMEQRGVTSLPTCRPPPTGGGNDARTFPLRRRPASSPPADAGAPAPRP